MKKVFTLPFALVFALLVAFPVSAAAPIIETGGFDINYSAFDPQPCPGVDIWDHEVATYRMMSYFDEQGNLLRTQTHYQGTDNLYNPLKPSVVLSGDFNGTMRFDTTTGLFSGTGIPFHIVVPGYGTVMVRAGRWLEYPNVHVAGKDSEFDPKDLQQLCSLLANP